jgi:hypothetical protein
MPSEVFMISISSAVSGGLTWSKTPNEHGYELKRQGETVASLLRTKWCSSEYLAESQHGKWRIRRTGFWRAATEIVDSTSEVRVAGFKPHWSGGGTLVFSDGQIFQLTCRGLWRPVWTVRTDNGQLVLCIHSRQKMVDLRNELHLPEDRLILLAIFTWRILQQAAEDAASVAVVVAVTS